MLEHHVMYSKWMARTGPAKESWYDLLVLGESDSEETLQWRNGTLPISMLVISNIIAAQQQPWKHLNSGLSFPGTIPGRKTKIFSSCEAGAAAQLLGLEGLRVSTDYILRYCACFNSMERLENSYSSLCGSNQPDTTRRRWVPWWFQSSICCLGWPGLWFALDWGHGSCTNGFFCPSMNNRRFLTKCCNELQLSVSFHHHPFDSVFRMKTMIVLVVTALTARLQFDDLVRAMFFLLQNLHFGWKVH